jgi:hypothetical protein
MRSTGMTTVAQEFAIPPEKDNTAAFKAVSRKRNDDVARAPTKGYMD